MAQWNSTCHVNLKPTLIGRIQKGQKERTDSQKLSSNFYIDQTAHVCPYPHHSHKPRTHRHTHQTHTHTHTTHTTIDIILHTHTRYTQLYI